MVKRKSKAKELIILIRLPDADSHQGIGTLTIQRGDLGHLQQFDYRGLTLKGNISEAIQAALLKLAQVEAAPPPDLSPSVSSPPDPDSVADEAESVSNDLLPDEAEEDENAAEMAEKVENRPATPPLQSVSGETANYDTDDTLTETHPPKRPKSPKQVSVSVVAKPTDISTAKQQITLF